LTLAKKSLIAQAKLIIDEYRERGLRLTVRQLYYQFVSRDWVANNQKEYNRISAAVAEGRNHGLIPWDMIEDRTRHVRGTDRCYDTDPIHRIHNLPYGYNEDPWQDQRYRPEVWIEKDALVDLAERGCSRYDADSEINLTVPFLSCRGYVSETLIYNAAKRLEQHVEQGLIPIVLHLGDHDPSGLHMTEDIEGKLWKFTRGKDVEVRRIALNGDQIDQFHPPPNLVKDSDSRSAAYKEEYGDDCWELDALDPQIIIDLIRGEIDEMINKDALKEVKKSQEANRKILETVSERWEDIAEFLKRDKDQ
jgi:hypothetical protein